MISLLGGVALFLFGMTLMGEGLKKAAGSKLEKAKKLGVKIIGEAEFLAALSKSAQKREEEKK